MSDPRLCIVIPNGLQTLLMAAGLVCHLALTHQLLLVIAVGHLGTASRLFRATGARYWFHRDDSKALSLGYKVLYVPNDPIPLYCSSGLSPADMHHLFAIERDNEREERALRWVTDKTGPTFLLVDGAVDPATLPDGLPLVRTEDIPVDQPTDLCLVLQHAAQVHAVDGWVLTLADLVGGQSRKFCHTYALDTGPNECRRKYRKKVTLVTLQ